MKFTILTLGIILSSLTLTAQQSLVLNYSNSTILSSINPTEVSNCFVIETESTVLLQNVEFNKDDAMFNTTAEKEISFIELRNESGIVFQNFPVFSKNLHLNLSNYTEGEYKLVLKYDDSSEHTVVQINH